MKIVSSGDLKFHKDTRGTFVRTFDQNLEEFRHFTVTQVNISHNPTESTLRGLHFQVSGPPEEKIVFLISGSVFIVTVDLRENSPNYLSINTIEMIESKKRYIYIPSGYATGWISTAPNTSLQYLMSARFEECEYSGIRYDDPGIEIKWPRSPVIISEQDLTWPTFNPKRIRP